MGLMCGFRGDPGPIVATWRWGRCRIVWRGFDKTDWSVLDWLSEMKGVPLSEAHKLKLAEGRAAARLRKREATVEPPPKTERKRVGRPKRSQRPPAAPKVEIAAEPSPLPPIGVHVLLFGPIGPRGVFGTALYETTLLDAGEIAKRLGARAISEAVSNKAEMDRLRAHNEQLSHAVLETNQALAVVQRMLGGAGNGGVVSRSGHIAGISAAGEEASRADGSEDGGGSYDFDGMMAELASVSDGNDEELLASDEVPLERIWEPRLKMWTQQRFWMSEEEWGPMPGRDGCQVPFELLQKFRLVPL